MGITHSFNGTVLTITSDSGTSSVDLKGEKGDTGIRGPQGAAGIIVDATGEVNLTGYYTKEETYSKTEIDNTIGKSQKEDKKLYNNLYANALRGTASGETINLTDVSPNEHTLGVKVSSKNLFDVGKVEDYEYPISGASAVNLSIENNSISGVISADGDSAVINTKHRIRSGTYIFSSTVTITNDVTPNYRYLVRPYDSNGNIITDLNITNWEYNKYYKAYIYHSSAQKQAITVPNTISYWQYGLVFLGTGTGTIGQTATYSNIQLELGSTATAYTPYISDFTTVNVTTCGKNLIPYPYERNTWKHNGITYNVNSDGSIIANGTFENISATSFITVTSSSLAYVFKLPLGRTYTSSGSPQVEGVNTTINYCNLENGNTLDEGDTQNGTPKTFTTSTETPRTGIQIYLKSKGTVTTVNNVVFKPQIELGSNATPYEPYQDATYTPTATGAVEDVTSISPDMTLMTDTAGITIDCEYNRDINKAFAELQQAIISSGGNI